MNTAWQKLKTYWKRLPIEKRGSIAITIPLACLIGAVVAATLLRQRLIDAQVYINRTNQVLVKNQHVLISLLNAETGVRGYYIGHQQAFLAPYTLALTTLTPALNSLEQLVQDNPRQVQRVQLLTQIAQQRMQLLQHSVQRVDKNIRSSPAVINERLIAGKRSMDQFRAVSNQLDSEEYRLLAQRVQALQDQQELNTDVMWGGILISLLGTALAMKLLQQLAIELRSREVRLRESRNLIQAIVANVVDGVMVVNIQGHIETFNRAAAKMFGYTAEEVVGWPWQKLLTAEAEATQKLLFHVPDLLVVAMSTGQIWQAMGQRKNGDWFPIEVSINSIFLDDDRIMIIRDITERQQVAAKLQATAAQLTILNASLITSNQSLLQSNNELNQFAYITSHDLKAPLRAIASLSEWVEEDLAGSMSAETRLNMQLLRGRVYRMQGLLDSLLEYSQSGRRQQPMQTVDVDRLLTEVIQSLSPPHTFTINVLSPMPTLHTRRQPLQQVLSHLIDNAIRHHPTAMGTVEVSVIDQGDRYEFAVADNGDGIDPQFQQRIYTIFQTLKARDLQENIGAGLAIIKKIVAAEGGTIQLESAAGSGAIFRFTWLKRPIVNADSAISHEQ